MIKEHSYVTRVENKSIANFLSVLSALDFHADLHTLEAFSNYSKEDILQHPLKDKPYFDKNMFAFYKNVGESEIYITIYHELQGWFDKTENEFILVISSNKSYQTSRRTSDWFLEIDSLIKSLNIVYSFVLLKEVIDDIITDNLKYFVYTHENYMYVSSSEHMYFGVKYIDLIGFDKIISCPAYEKQITGNGRIISINCSSAGNVIMTYNYLESVDKIFDRKFDELRLIENYFATQLVFMKVKLKTRIFLIALLGTILALGVLLTNLSSVPSLTHNTPLPSSAPPPFYTGGLEKGSGGQAASASSSDYTHDGLFAPSPASTITGGLLTLESYPSPAVCARCHVGIHNNWQNSMHAVSATDPWYLKVKEQLQFERPQAEERECAGCHAPIALMTGEVGLYNTESASSKQGVSCFFCHSVERSSGGNGAYVSNPGRIRAYAGGNYLSEAGIEAAEHLVMLSPEVHKADMLPGWMRGNSGSKLCQSCHELVKNGVKLQSTYSEWLASSYAKKGVSCQGCHFTPGAGETVEAGNLVEHYPKRAKVLRHMLGGGSTVNSPRAKDNQAILREAVGLKAARAGNSLTVKVTNLKAGHSMPTGVTDLRQMWLEVTAQDAGGQSVYSSGVLDAGGQQPQGTVLFHTVFGDDKGNPLVRHDIWRVAKVLKDTRLKAEETRAVPYQLPSSAKMVRVRLLWRDAPADFASWVLKQNGADLPTVELAVVNLE